MTLPRVNRSVLGAYCAALVVLLVISLGIVDLLEAGATRSPSSHGDLGLLSVVFFGLAVAAGIAAGGATIVAATWRSDAASPGLRRGARGLVLLAASLTLFVVSWVGARVARAVAPASAPPAGSITAFNPTATRFDLTVNGRRQFVVPPTNGSLDWLPARSSGIPRSPSGHPSDGAFGWDNKLTVAQQSAGGELAPLSVSVPRWLQTVNDLELYLLYGSSGHPGYLLLFQGDVVGDEIPASFDSTGLHPASTKRILTQPSVNPTTKQEAAMAGAITIFNPTATAFTITVNGTTQFDIPATTQTAKWLPATGKNPIPRSDSGQPSDGQFGWANTVQIFPKSGGGDVATAKVNIPRQLQTVNDLQLYLFYDADPTNAVWVLMFQGEIVDHGGMR
jgi:hypothetical protein